MLHSVVFYYNGFRWKLYITTTNAFLGDHTGLPSVFIMLLLGLHEDFIFA